MPIFKIEEIESTSRTFLIVAPTEVLALETLEEADDSSAVEESITERNVESCEIVNLEDIQEEYEIDKILNYKTEYERNKEVTRIVLENKFPDMNWSYCGQFSSGNCTYFGVNRETSRVEVHALVYRLTGEVKFLEDYRQFPEIETVEIKEIVR